jgi:hypothetical protein
MVAIAASLACPMRFKFWTQICLPTQITLDRGDWGRVRLGEPQRIKWLALRSVSMSFCEAAADVKIAISDALASSGHEADRGYLPRS